MTINFVIDAIMVIGTLFAIFMVSAIYVNEKDKSKKNQKKRMAEIII